MNKLAALFALALPLLASSTPAHAGEKTGVKITAIRVYADTNIHVDFSQPVSTACGGRLRLNGTDPGQEQLLRIATSALLAGSTVNVGHEDAKSGSYCNIDYIQIVTN